MSADQTSAPAHGNPLSFGSAESSPIEDTVDFRKIFDILLSGWWLIAIVIVVVTLLTAAYAITIEPVYRATGLMQVETEKNQISASVDQLQSLIGSKPGETSAEIEIIKSRMVLGTVIDRLHLDIRAQPNYFPIIGRAWARRAPRQGTIAEAPFGLRRYAWGGENLRVTSFEVPTSRQDEKFELKAGGNGSYVLQDLAGKLVLTGKVGERAGNEDEKISIFVQELRAAPDTTFSVSKPASVLVFSNVGSMLNILEKPKDSGILSMQVDASSPEFAEQLLNEVEVSYLTQSVERRSAQAQQSLDFLKKQLPELKAKTNEAESKLNAYKLEVGSVDVQQETQLLLKQVVDLETQRLTMQQQREAAKERFTNQHPTVIALNQQVAALERVEADMKRKAESLPQRQQEVFGLMRDVEVNNQLYTTLLNSAQQLQVAKAGTTGNVRIVDHALSFPAPIKPQRKLIVFYGFMLGLILGVAAVFAQRAMLRGVDRPEEVEQALGLAAYASVPYSDNQKLITRGLRNRKVSGILAATNPSDVAIEAVRALRTSLHFAMLEASNNIVMFTGPVAALGKSFVSINLGAVLAQGGKRVVVIDADMRRGILYRYAGVPQKPGLSDQVTGTARLEQTLHKTSVEGLDFIAGGTRPPNPAEILMSESFTDILKKLSKDYDYVLVDTPPVLPVTDAAIIGRYAGTTLVVLKAAEHPMRVIDECVKRLRRGGATVRGVIFNQVGARMGSYGYGAYGYSYGYSAKAYSSEQDEPS